jgi:hypothetical protein
VNWKSTLEKVCFVFSLIFITTSALAIFGFNYGAMGFSLLGLAIAVPCGICCSGNVFKVRESLENKPAQ